MNEYYTGRKKEKIEFIPSDLNPKDRGSYIISDCPACSQRDGKSNSLFLYKNSFTATCNRINECAYKVKIWDLGKVNFKEAKEMFFETEEDLLRKRLKNKKRADYCEWSIGPALSCHQDDMIHYLEKRIPGIDVRRKILNKRYAGWTGRLKGHKKTRKWRDDLGYKLLTPLYNIKSGRIVSAQTRFVFEGQTPRIKKTNGEPAKNLSLAGGYGEGGATFGSLRLVLAKERRKKEGTGDPQVLIIAEGDIDYLTFVGNEYENCVGVPGCQQAKNVIRYLQDVDWRGIVLLSLDGDNAGEKSVQEVTKIVEDNGKLEVWNARPAHCDINDAYRYFGGEIALQRILEYARPLKGNKSLKKAIEDKIMAEIQRHKLYVRPRFMPNLVKDRYRVNIRGDKGEDGAKSKLKPIARAINCREVQELEIEYKDGAKFGKQANIKARVAESPACLHCLSGQWNYHIATFIRKHWPEELYYTTIDFEEGNIDQALAKRGEICALTRTPREQRERYGEDYGKSLCILIDVMKSQLIIISGAKSRNDIILTNLRYLGTIKKINREELMRERILPAYISYGKYVIEKGEDFSHSLVDDKILTKQFHRYYSRSGLPFPKQKDTREEVRKYFASLRPTDEEGDKKKEGGHSIFVTFRERDGIFKKLIALSWKSISFDNITRADVFNLPMNFDPRDPQAVNFLENPESAPKPVKEIIDDFFWIRYGHPSLVPSHMNIPGYTGVKTINLKKIEKKKVIRTERDYWEEMMAWSGEGYDPSKYDFGPGEMPLEEFIKIRDGVIDPPI